jgi:hypothetical protein
MLSNCFKITAEASISIYMEDLTNEFRDIFSFMLSLKARNIEEVLT